MFLRVSKKLMLAGLLLAASSAWARSDATAPLIAQGEYIYRASGCLACHTDLKHHGKTLAGGRALTTPFGTFYTPNITPDLLTGIGKWTEQDFFRAMRQGMDPGGRHLYPAFPYPAYTRLSDQDLRALWAYLRTLEPIQQANRNHDLKWFVARPLVRFWKWLYFKPGPYQSDPQKSPSWNRGAYLAEAAAHCSECHTPRTVLGASDPNLRYAGTPSGPDNSVIPNITQDKNTGIGKWTQSELVSYLDSGTMPDGDSAGDLMAEVIDNGLHYLSKDDLSAIAEYITALPAINHSLRKPGKKKTAPKEAWE